MLNRWIQFLLSRTKVVLVTGILVTIAAAAYGLPGRNAAELMLERLNAAGGVKGLRLKPVFVDEAQGGAGVVSEFRRLAGDDSVLLAVAALSSASCLALAPIARHAGPIVDQG